MTTATTQGATMTLPPCPIAGHNNPHHFHDLTRPPSTNGGDLYAVNGTPHRACDFEGKEFSRCYSAHVPEPTEAAPLVTLPTVDQIAEAIVTDCLKGGPVTGEGWHVTAAKAVLDLLATHVPGPAAEPAADEWVRVPHPTPLPPEMAYRCWSYQNVSSIGWTPSVIAEVYVRRSDLDAIPLPAPTPAEKLAEALTQLVIGAEDAWLPDDVQSALDAAGLPRAEVTA